MIKISKKEAIELMKQTQGSIFSAVFIKKDGTKRHINCRTGVTKDLKGVGLKFDPTSKGLFTVYDMQVKGYRMINIHSLESLQINKQFYTIIN